LYAGAAFAASVASVALFVAAALSWEEALYAGAFAALAVVLLWEAALCAAVAVPEQAAPAQVLPVFRELFLLKSARFACFQGLPEAA